MTVSRVISSTVRADNKKGSGVRPALLSLNAFSHSCINHQAIASYLVSLYCSLAVLVDDALAVLDDVAIDRYHEYKWPS